MTTSSYPPPASNSVPDPHLFRADSQAFLVGDTIFLRGLEEEDAHRASAWSDSPFPVSAERATELIRERIAHPQAGQRFWVACRRDDGEPVGSLTYTRYPESDLVVDLVIHANPSLPGASQVQAEMLRLFTAWAFDEAELPAFRIHFDEDAALVAAAAQAVGSRHCATLREARWRHGRWRNTVVHEGYHPAWVSMIGEPDSGIAHAVAPDDPGRWRPRQHPTLSTVDGDPPINAVMVGPRIYLRPLEMSDASGAILGLRREDETGFYDEGRQPGSAAALRQHYRSIAEGDPPRTIRFAVCLRATGEHIGTNGLYRVSPIHQTAGTESFFHDGATRNRGYGTEAKHLLLAFAFERIGLHSVHSWVWGPNLRSAAALRKQGYRDAGRLAWAGTKHGIFTHGTYFDLLADEWREMTARASTAHAVAVAR